MKKSALTIRLDRALDRALERQLAAPSTPGAREVRSYATHCDATSPYCNAKMLADP